MGFDLIYIFSDYFDFYVSNEVISVNIIFFGLSVVLFFLSNKNKQEIEVFKSVAKYHIITTRQKQNMIGFALQQLRTTVNNFSVYDDFSVKNIDLKDIENYKRISLSSFCAAMAVIEESSSDGIIDNSIEKCNFFDIVKKITTYYSIKNPLIKFKNALTDNLLFNDINTQILFIKIIFSVFDVITLFYSQEKLQIRIENYVDSSDENFDYLLFVVNKNFVYNFNKTEELFIANEFLKELVKQINGKIDYGLIKGSESYIELTYNKNLFNKPKDKNITNESLLNKKKYKLLLAEDDEINQKIYTMSLDKFFAKIDIAIDGEEVISKIATEKYDAVIMDLQMPKINGIEAIEIIREMETKSENRTPIIAITANTLIYNRLDIIKFGFDDYFIKPYKIKDIYYSNNSLIFQLAN